MLCGTPFIIDPQVAVFYPFNWIYLISDIPALFGYLLIFHIVLLQLFMYLFLQEIGLSKTAAILGALSFSFGGFITGHIVHPMMVQVLTWLPALLWTVTKLFHEKNSTLLYTTIGAIIMSLQILAGHLEISVYLTLIFLVFSGYKLFTYHREQKNTKKSLQYGLCIISILFLGLLIGGIQLLPTMRFGLFTNARAIIASYPLYIKDAMNFKHLLSFIIPDFFGNPIHKNYIGKLNYTEYCGYIGFLPFLLAFFGILNQKFKEKNAFIFLVIVSCAFILGSPLCRIAYFFIPGFEQLRSPFRLLAIYTFSASVLAAGGFDWIFARKERINNFRNFLLILLLLSSVVLLSVYIFKDWFLALGMRQSQYFSERFYDYQVKNLLKLSMTILVFYVIFPFHTLVRLKNSFLRGAIILFVFGDLFIFGNLYNSSVKKELFAQTVQMDFLKNDTSLYRIGCLETKDILPPNSGMYFGIQDNRGYSTFIQKDYAEFMNHLDTGALQLLYNQVQGFSSEKAFDSKLFDLLNIKYVLSARKITRTDFTLIQNNGFYVYKYTRALPRAFVVHAVNHAPTKSEQFTRLKHSGFNPRTEAITNMPAPFMLTENSSENDAVKIMRYTPNNIELCADLAENGLLVLLDKNYQGWNVYVDKKRERLVNVNAIFKGVYLAKGKHLVKFSFEPRDLQIGFYFSVLGISILGCMAFMARKKNSHESIR